MDNWEEKWEEHQAEAASIIADAILDWARDFTNLMPIGEFALAQLREKKFVVQKSMVISDASYTEFIEMVNNAGPTEQAE